MAHTIHKLELTRAIQLLQGQISDLESRLAANIPKVEQDVSTVMEAAKSMFEALKAEVQPEENQIPPLRVQ